MNSYLALSILHSQYTNILLRTLLFRYIITIALYFINFLKEHSILSFFLFSKLHNTILKEQFYLSFISNFQHQQKKINFSSSKTYFSNLIIYNKTSILVYLLHCVKKFSKYQICLRKNLRMIKNKYNSCTLSSSNKS